MSDLRDGYERSREDGRWLVEQGGRDARSAVFSLFFKVLLPISLVLGTVSYLLWWPSQAATVVQDEFGPKAALEKYTWFKEAAAQLDAKQASIQVLRGRTKGMDDTYKGTARVSWPREDREQYNVWTSEVAGVTASYNSLAAEYNAKMAEFHWRFANAGSLPQGASDPLPREFKPYDDN